MAQYRDKKTSLEELLHDMCKEIKGLNHQICRVTWEAIKKLITTQLTFDRNILILDAFYVKQTKNKNATHFVVLPTSSLLAQSLLNYRSDSSEMTLTSLINITQANLFKHVSQHDKQNTTINKQSVFLVYSMLFKAIKNIVKKYKNANIELDFLGRILIYQKTFVHEPQLKNLSTQKVTVRDLFVPQNFQARRNSFTKKSKREITSNNHLEILNNNESFLMSQSKQSINLKSFNVHCQNTPSEQYLQSYQKSFKPPKNHVKYTKKPFINDFSLINHPENIRICDDLLGAGIDPLTYDYNLSKLVDNTNNLLQKQFTKPDKAKTRFPCVIDKFARTIASQLTGAKISTSSVIRIGSNYSPLVRNLYLDLTKKKIMYVPQEVTIKLQGNKSKQIVPATQNEEYQFLINELKFDKTFQQKIKLRQTIYKRYRQYLKNHIPNQCIAPIKKETLEKIVAPIRSLVRQLGVQKGKKIFEELINEVNKWYYYADKKAILDYILKDKSEKVRTGIYIEFNPISDWGKGKKQHLIYSQSSMGNFQQNRQYLKQNLLHYADCFLQVVKQNQEFGDITLIRVLKQNQYRPTNVLYYMKKHTNHLKECIVYLNQKWVKKIVQTITKNRNWKKENSHKFRQFLNSVHVQMSNKLKEIVYKSLQILSNIFQNFNSTNKNQETKKIVHLSMGQQNGKIIVSDDLNNIFKKDIVEFQHSIIEETRKILAPECYIRQGEDRFLWGVSDDDQFYVKSKLFIKEVAQVNYNEIEQIECSLKKFEKIFSFKEQLVKWCKNIPKIDEIKQKMSMIKNLESQIEDIPFFRQSKIAIIDCHQLKKKLLNQTKNMKNLLFETIEEIVKKNNSKVLQKIDYHSSQISKDIVSTSDYVKLSQSIQFIKKTLYQQIMGSIEQNRKILIKLYQIENTFVSHQLLRYVFQSHRACQVLKNKLLFNEERILKEKTELQKTLRERISNFQGTAGCQLKDVNLKIDSFEIRKLSNDYLNMLKQYKEKVQKNSQAMKELNRQQEDLKWALTTFSTAVQLENLVNPNYQLWSLVSEYDQCIKEWRHIQLCNFDHQSCQTRIQSIDTRIGKIINKLKNFSSLKIAHELQNDVKQILTQQIQIIKIFSHPGLKQRHWHLFNKKLAIPGYDLKQISYGRIKMLYDYQKNLKVLMSISNQAAKQYQIQNQKNDMHDYWYNLTFQIYSSVQESLIFVKDDFLDKQIHIIEDHLMRTILIKNSPFSKALVQMLGDWQNWLSIGKKILIGFRRSQQKFIYIKDIFKIDQISRYLPIENTQFQTIQNIWKSVIKKILEQPKVYQFFKGQKILQIIQQINKKADYLKSGLSIYFHAKRLQFPRFFFVKDQQLASIFSLVNQGKNNEIFNKVVHHCFNGVNEIQIKSKQDSIYIIKSLIDSIQIKSKNIQQQNTNIVARHKQKLKVSQQMSLICDSLGQEIKHQINQYLQINNLKEQFLKSYTMTALSTYMSIAFTKKLMNIFQSQNEKIQNHVIKCQNEINQFLEQCNQISVTKKDFVLMRKIHELQVLQYLHDQGINELTNYDFQLIPKTYKSRNNSISVHILDKQLKYEYQYMGHDLNGYLPNTCSKIMYQFVQTLSINQVCITKNKKSTQCIKSLSQFLGKYYKILEDSELFSQSNIFSTISGMICSQFWININDISLKLNLQALSIVSTYIHQKKIKINSDLRFLMVRQNDVALNANTGIFLTLSQEKLQKIPSQYLTYSRIVSLVQASQNDVFYKIGMKDWSLITRFKALLQLFKIENLASQTMYSTISQLQEMIGKCPLQNLQNLILKILQREKNEQKQHLVNEFIKIKQQKRKSIQCQIMQAQKEKVKDQIESYIISKAQQLHSQLLFYDAAIVYGDYSFKTTIIRKLLKFYGISEEECSQMTINLQTYESQNIQQDKNQQQEFSIFKYLQKALRTSQKLHNSKHQIKVIIVQGVYLQQKIQVLSRFMKKVTQYNKAMKAGSTNGFTNAQLKIIIELNSIQNFSPFQLTKYGRVFVQSTFVSNSSLFHQWCNQLTYKAEQIAFIKTLTPSFENLITTVQKYQLQTNYSKLDRFICSKKFLNFFSIYLDNLKSKQIQSLPEFEMENYIANSFVYSAYWSLGIGCIKHQHLKQFITYLKQTFCNQLEITSELDQNFLNQENEWIQWQNLMQEFVPQKQNESVCNLWVPTMQNTKLYTIAIKFIQSNKPLMICGHSNGKSTLLKQVSNFQITYNSFLIDLHKKNCSNQLIKGIKEKIIYGDFKKNLILVDDVHLPNKSSIYQLLSDIVQHKTIPNISQVGILNYDVKNPSLLLTCGVKHKQNLHPSFFRLTSKMQTLFAPDMNQKQIQSVFRPYINYSLVNNDFDNSVLKLQSFIVGLISKLYDNFFSVIKVSDIRMIVESLCRITNDQFRDKNSVLKYLFLETYNILQRKFDVLQERKNFAKFLEAEYGKINGTMAKSPQQFIQNLQKQVYYDLPQYEQSKSATNLADLRELFEKILSKKGENNIQLSHMHTMLIQKIIHNFKNSGSHVILLSGKSSGSRTIAKIVASLKNLVYIQLGTNTSPTVFIEQIMKILKTGGKIDECVCCLPNQKNKQQQFLPLLNSIISSPQFCQSFNQVQIQQIIKSFNSQKKFLKKDVKRSELIKKIREKFNSIFHFFICMDVEYFCQVKENYPSMVDSCFLMEMQRWSNQANYSIGKKVLNSTENSQINDKIIKAFVEINKKLFETFSKKIKISEPLIYQLRIFESFYNLSNSIKNSAKQASEIWTRKIQQNSQKLQGFIKQKHNFQLAHKHNFDQLSQMKNLINQKEILLQKQIKQFKTVQEKYNQSKKRLQENQSSWFKEIQSCCTKMNDDIDQKLAKFDQNFNQNYFKFQNPVYKKIIESYCKDKTKLNLNQAIDILDQIKKNYFQKLFGLISKEQLQQSLQSEDKNLFSFSFIQILNDNWNSMKQIAQRKKQLDARQKEHIKQQSRYFKKQNQYRETEDQIEQLKEQMQQHQDKNAKTLQNYEDFNTKIVQIQSVIDILNQFSHIVKTKNQYSRSTESDCVGICIIFSVRLIYQQIITEQTQNLIQNVVKQIFLALQIPVSQDDIYNLLRFQDQLKFQHLYDSQTIQQFLNFLVLQLSGLYCIGIDSSDNIYQALNCWKSDAKDLNVLESDQIQQLKNYLARPGYLIINQPSEMLLNYLKNLIENKFDPKSSKKMYALTEQLNMHELSKIIFVYKSHQNIPEILFNNNKWIMKYSLSKNQIKSKILKRINNVLEDKASQKEVNSYIQKVKQISALDEKMHGIIVKMKKDNINIELITQKINEVNKEKELLQKSIEGHISNLRNQKDKLLDLKAKNIDLKLYEIFSKYEIKCQEFLSVLQYFLKKESLNIDNIQAAVQNALKIGIKQKNIEMTQDLPIKLQTKHSTKKKIQQEKILQNIRQKIEKQFENIKGSELYQLINIFCEDHCLVSSQNNELIKDYIILAGEIAEKQILYKKVEELSTLPLVSNLNALVQVKMKKDWQNLIAIVKSLKQKKMNVKLIILTSSQVEIPKSCSYIYRNLRVTSPLKSLLKFHYDDMLKSQQTSQVQSIRFLSYKLSLSDYNHSEDEKYSKFKEAQSLINSQKNQLKKILLKYD